VLRLGVLVSGRGSNLEAILRAIADGRLACEVALVVSNRADALGLEIARIHGAPTALLEHRQYASREQFDTALVGALARAGRMSMTIELPAIDAGAIGELIMMLEIATVVAGALYGVNPLDQPGVELGKVLTYGLMGRPGFPPPDDAQPDPGNVCA